MKHTRTAPSQALAAVALGFALVALAACGGSSDSATTTTSTDASSTTTSSSTSTTEDPNAGRGLDGLITPVAGNGSDDAQGIPGPALDASLGSATQFAVAPNGDIYMSNGALSVFKISGGQIGVFGDLDPPHGPGSGGIVVAPDGSVYVATPSTVRKFTADGSSTVVLDTTAAGLVTSLGPIAVDPDGNVYVGDGSPRVIRIAPDGTLTPIAGITGQAPADTAPGDGGPAIAAALGAPAQFAIDGSGNVLIADPHSHRLRQVAPDGTITTIAGGGTTPLLTTTQDYVADGTDPTDLALTEVVGVAVDAKGRIYVADAGYEAIFRFLPGEGIELVAASQKGSSETPGLPANQTRVRNPASLTFDTDGNLYYLEAGIIHRLADAGA